MWIECYADLRLSFLRPHMDFLDRMSSLDAGKALICKFCGNFNKYFLPCKVRASAP